MHNDPASTPPGVLVLEPLAGPTDRCGAWLEALEDAGLHAVRPDTGSVEGVLAAAAALAARDDLRTGPVGVVGFDDAAAMAIHAACAKKGGIGAVVALGGPIRESSAAVPGGSAVLDAVRGLRAPLLAVHAAHDDAVPLADVLALKERLGGRGHVIAYPRASSGWFDPADPAHRPEDAEDALRRATLFLLEHLAPDLLDAADGPSVPEWGGGGEGGGGGGGKPKGGRGKGGKRRGGRKRGGRGKRR